MRRSVFIGGLFLRFPLTQRFRFLRQGAFVRRPSCLERLTSHRRIRYWHSVSVKPVYFLKTQ